MYQPGQGVEEMLHGLAGLVFTLGSCHYRSLPVTHVSAIGQQLGIDKQTTSDLVG